MLKLHNNFYKTRKHNLINKYVLIICIIFISSNNIEAQNEKLSLLTAPEGFSIEIFAEDIKSPRQMTEGKKYIYTASGPMGEIYALLDVDNDKKIDSKITLAKGLNNSRGVTFKDGDLYFAEDDKIWVIENVEVQLD